MCVSGRRRRVNGHDGTQKLAAAECWWVGEGKSSHEHQAVQSRCKIPTPRAEHRVEQSNRDNQTSASTHTTISPWQPTSACTFQRTYMDVHASQHSWSHHAQRSGKEGKKHRRRKESGLVFHTAARHEKTERVGASDPFDDRQIAVHAIPARRTSGRRVRRHARGGRSPRHHETLYFERLDGPAHRESEPFPTRDLRRPCKA
jgi:hypothetical protein